MSAVWMWLWLCVYVVTGHGDTLEIDVQRAMHGAVLIVRDVT